MNLLVWFNETTAEKDSRSVHLPDCISGQAQHPTSIVISVALSDISANRRFLLSAVELESLY